MENASKALLIAASVLIAIVLIAVGIKILGSAQGVTNSVDTVSQSLEVSIFNAQFTKYEGRINIAEVKQLLNTIILNNERQNANAIKIDIADNNRGSGDVWDTTDERDLENLRKWMSLYCNYEYYVYFDVEFNYDSNGRVEEVDILGEDI